MDQLININSGQSVFIDGREHTFCQFVESEEGLNQGPDDLQFADKRNGRVRTFTRQEFDQLYLDKRLRWKLPTERQEDRIPEEHCDDSTLRTIRLRFVKAFDESPVPKTDNALAALYAEVLAQFKKEDAKFSPAEWPRSGGSLRRWINQRGEPGNRPSRCMGDRRRRGPQGMKFDPVALEAITKKAERYWDNLRVTTKDIWADVRVELRGINTDRKSKGLPCIRVPSRTSIWRYLTSHSDYDKTRRRFGARIADRMFTPLKGSLEAKHILDAAIMDHTWADCHVVDDVNNVPVGRPYITLLIDVHSRYPLSYIIGFTPPSLETAMACIRSAVRPKKWINQRFPDIQGNWVAYGVPRTIKVDNGWEFTGGSFKDACEDAGISVEWAPVRTPEYKGICERFFRTLNQLIIHKIKGSVPFPPHRLKELGLDPSADAVILLSELEELICQTIVEVYGREFHKGINAVPEQAWRTDQAMVGIDYAADLNALDHSLGKMGPQRKLTRAGIEFNSLVYRSEAVADLLKHLLPRERKRGRRGDGAEVKFKYWPEDLSKITVWDPVDQRYVELPCVDQTYTRGLSEHHHKVLRQFAIEQGLQFSSEDERCAARARLNDKISSFVTTRKIGDRRRVQRIIAEKSYLNVQSDLPSDETINVIETVSNRTKGDEPLRSAPRARRKGPTRAGRKPIKTTEPSPTNAVAPSSPSFLHDPFASFNRDALLEL